MQYLRLLPGDRSPALYEPGVMYYGETGKAARPSAKNTVVGTEGSPRPHPVYPAPYPIDGVVACRECPDGYGEFHLNGSMSFTVVEEGTFEDPQVGGHYVGYWKPERTYSGSSNRSGAVDIDYQNITFNYRRGLRTGNRTFTLRPGRIFIDPARFQSMEQIRDVFRMRAMKAASILAKYGWNLTDPKLDRQSDIEVADKNSPWVHFIPRGPALPGADIFVDGSHGSPEAEGLEEDEMDPDDDEYYAVVEYYEHPNGDSAEVFYLDEDRKEIGDIRFWMVVDEDERERFMKAYDELHPESEREDDGVLFAPDPYSVFLYQKALGRF